MFINKNKGVIVTILCGLCSWFGYLTKQKWGKLREVAYFDNIECKIITMWSLAVYFIFIHFPEKQVNKLAVYLRAPSM